MCAFIKYFGSKGECERLSIWVCVCLWSLCFVELESEPLHLPLQLLQSYPKNTSHTHKHTHTHTDMSLKHSFSICLSLFYTFFIFQSCSLTSSPLVSLSSLSDLSVLQFGRVRVAYSLAALPNPLHRNAAHLDCIVH